MTVRRSMWVGAVLLATLAVLGAQPALAQSQGTIELTSQGVVLERPRGDSLVIGTLDVGVVVMVVDRRGAWYYVQAPDGVTEWRRGWIHRRYFEVLTQPAPDAAEKARPQLRSSVRGFGQLGLIRFTASDSFDAITGSPLGVMYGGGAQVGFSNGLFFQGSVERYEETGERVFVFEDQIFQLGITNTVTVTPIQLTVGYRQASTESVVGYVGGGLGWHRFEEQADLADPSLNVDETKIGYHVLGGVEYPLTRWLWIGGEGQWSYVPDVLGNDGISAAFQEDDLGGFTIRLKLSVGL